MKTFNIKFGFLCAWITNFGQGRRLAIGDVDIFCQDSSGLSFTEITNLGHVGRLAIEAVNIFCQNIPDFLCI